MPLSRRHLLRMAGSGLAGGSAVVLLGGCAADADDAERAARQRAAVDIEILNSALDLEHTSIAAYTAGAKVLRGEQAEVARHFRDQEREHADGLREAIRDLGGTPNAPRETYDFPALLSERDALRFAAELEATAVAAYIDGLPNLSDPDLRATVAAITTTEAEHIAVLRTALGDEPVPQAFVTGSSA